MHHQLNNYSQNVLQVISMSVEDSDSLSTILTVYLPPRHTVKQKQFEGFYINLGCRFIAGGDHNAKHADWGSRHITSKGSQLLKTIESNDLREPTYWPSDSNKIPDLVNFCVTTGIPQRLR
jgi:hypothetical protein